MASAIRCGSAVVQIRAGVSQAPERGRSPFTGRGGACAGARRDLRARGRPALVVLTGEDGIGVGVAELGTHIVQEQVTVDPVDVAQFRQVAACAADRFEG